MPMSGSLAKSPQSRPTRARGLKLRETAACRRPSASRPTRARGLKYEGLTEKNVTLMSRPTRARGLKCAPSAPHRFGANVAPHTGAWIEMLPIKNQTTSALASRPTRARGLKYWTRIRRHQRYRSRPTRARGLKFTCQDKYVAVDGVAPHTGAWIEIRRRTCRSMSRCVAPHTGAWIEIPQPTPRRTPSSVAPHTGAWIEMRVAHSKHMG